VSQAVVLLERGRFSSPRLAHLQRELRETGPQASTAIARLRRILEMHDWQHNMVFVPVAAVLMWSVHLAWALEGVAAAARRARPRVGAHHRGVRGAGVAVGVRVRTPRRPVSARSPASRRRAHASRAPGSAIRWCPPRACTPTTSA
jgi:hypothetical protein